jgi:hypothetical protein
MASGPSSRRRPGFIENLSFFPFLVSSISSVFLLFLLSLSFSVARAQRASLDAFPGRHRRGMKLLRASVRDARHESRRRSLSTRSQNGLFFLPVAVSVFFCGAARR